MFGFGPVASPALAHQGVAINHEVVLGSTRAYRLVLGCCSCVVWQLRTIMASAKGVTLLSPPLGSEGNDVVGAPAGFRLQPGALYPASFARWQSTHGTQAS
eukprot:10366231-Karenia_brevis.AAC.1